jgi:Sulfotransferase family
VEWYEAQFEGASTTVCGEASPQYTKYPRIPEVPERMHAVIPEARLIYLVRDPIERIVSAYVGEYASRSQPSPLTAALTPLEGNPYVCDSSYHMQLERFLRHYPSERILVISREELLRERRATLRKVFRFLGVDPSFDTPRFDQVKNQSAELRRIVGPRWISKSILPKPTGRLPWRVRARARRILYRPVSKRVELPAMEPALRQALAEHLRPEVERLRRLTGMAFPEWSI